jgi:Holliday junction resolvase RusA-like endonuclease
MGGELFSSPGDSVAPPISLELPCPPSVNELFWNKPGRGRVKTRVYADWLGHAGWRLREQRPGRIAGRVIIVMSIERSNANADIDNRIKPILDLLVSQHVIDDDRFVVGLCIAWAPAASKLARVMILPAGNYAFDFHLATDGATGGWFMQAPQPELESA